MPDAEGQERRVHFGAATAGADYTDRLHELQSARWKQVLDVQRPYRRNLQRLHPGRCLDVGCGIGRNLPALGPDSVGVDHNASSIALCRSHGFIAYVSQDLAAHVDHGSFDSLLMAHLLEHVDADAGAEIFRTYLPYLRSGGQVIVITPQEWGFRSDPTHIRWVTHREVIDLADAFHLTIARTYSFPFPRVAGRVFKYNEFVTVLRKEST